MNTIMKKLISLMLCFVLVASCLPTSALATDGGMTATTGTTEVTTGTTASEEVAVTGITLDQTALEVGVGAEPVTLTATVLPENATDKNVTWTSSEPGVASVVDGVVTFGYMGEAVITATAGDYSAECTVNVVEGEWSAYADDSVDYLFVATDRHTNTSIIKTMIDNMEKNIGENELDYLALGGDMVGSGSSHPTYISSTVLSEVTGATTSLSAANVDIVAGIHDMKVNDDAGIVLDYSSNPAQIYEGNKFYVYGVPESSISGGEEGVTKDCEAMANAFVEWANNVADKTKAIIVVSHYPLHVRRNDNDGAVYWVKALNSVAAGNDTTIDRNVAFFWGHNHTGETSADTAVYHVAPNGSISVQGGSSNQTIYFTYANAGYLNSHSSATLITITDSTITYDKYKNSSVSTTNSVDRIKAAATVTGIEVTGETVYTVGGNGFDLTVTATYSDGTTADVTDDTACTLTGCDLTTSGDYTVTASYGGMTDTIDVKVYLYAEDDSNLVGVEVFSQGATDLTVTWDDAAEAVLDSKGVYTDYVVYDLALTNPGATTEYAMTLVDNMDTSNLVVYHVAEDGTLTVVPSEIANDCVVFTTSLTGTFAYGAVTVPEGYTLSSLTMEGIPYDVFKGTAVDLFDSTITATYTKEGAEDFVRVLTVYDYDETNFSGFDVNTVGKQTVVFTFEGMTATAKINVWSDTVEDEASGVTVQVGEGEYGVTEAVVAESTNENVSSAIANVIEGDNYVAYDITLTYADGYTANSAAKTVTLPLPEGITNPVVYYVSDSGKSVVDMKAEVTEDGKSVTFTTTHFSTYVLGDGTVIETGSQDAVVESTTSTTTKTVYVLTSSISSGKSYLIVNGNAAGNYYALANNNGSVAATGVTIKTDSSIGTYIELDDAADELWLTASGYTFQNGSYYLGYTTSGNSWNQSYSFGLSTTARDWSYSTSNHRLSTSVGGWDSTTYYLRYNSGWTWTNSNNASGRSVYFYVPTEITVTTGTPGHTYSVEGADMEVAAVKDATVDLSSVLYDTPTDTNVKTDITASSGLTPTYEIVSDTGILSESGTLSGSTVTLTGKTGYAVLKATYTSGDLTAWDEFVIEAVAPDHFSIQLHKAELTPVTITKFEDGITYYTYNSATNTYDVATSYVEGTTYYTVPVIQGDEITSTIALKGIETGDTYAVWAVVKAYASADDTTGTDIGTLGDALSWSVSDTSIATIDPVTGIITFTGRNYGDFTVTVAYEGADGQVITDTITISVTDTLYIVPEDGTDDFPEYPNEGAVRFDKTATAVGNFSETGIAKVELSMTGVPYTTGNELDVVLMLDMTGSMDDVTDSASKPTGYVRVDASIAASKAFIETIVKNEDGSYNKNRIGVYVFNKNGASTLLDFGTIDNDDEFYALVGKVGSSGVEYGTDYTSGTLDTVWEDFGVSGGTPYDDGLAKCQEVLAANKTEGRQQFAVFMTDGVPTNFEYITGTTHANYSSASDIAGMLTSSSDYATRDSDYKYEYYSTEMKKAGVTVYSVGVGLFNKNNAWSGSATQCGNLASALLNDISGPANEASQPDAVGTATLSKKDSYFFSVDDADAGTEMTKVFENIAQKILEAATDVVVEDKIGNDYNVNFSIPGYGTDNAVSADALDGTTEFYIQVVEYSLNADKERTGDPTVLENFTFNANGTLKSHTVDGVACSGCAHVTSANGVITAIDGTYFDYKSDSTGEYLTWEADKLTTTELALQYFAYLEDSSGVAAADQVAPGTYYTNEYATLTYTNVNGNRVQQEFPIPQMTWYGAQVSYVFYLVNEAGQPVNKAGRVVPFAEAVYVTDVNTYAIVWNDLEQSASLDAGYLAQSLVPKVYALYDDDASYNIHVYANEEGVNLNNHFVIGGDVTDDYNTTTHSWTNAKTTYVFNTKADGTKYNVVGAYIANDGSDTTTSSSYYCKSAYLKNATYTTSVDAAGVTVYTVTSVGDGYQKVDGETQVLASALESTTGGTIIGDYVYYVDEAGVYTIVKKTDGTEVRSGFDFANTTVAFAVVWKPELQPDTVVIDYGLDVVIDVITNDSMAAGVTGVMLTAPDVATDGSYDTAVGSASVTSTDGIWTATVENLSSVRFSLNNMELSASAKFFYEAGVNYYKTNATEITTTNMYSSVTVIPATTIYYEDDFVTFKSYTKGEDGSWPTTADETNKWTTSVQSGTQDQDRPGESKISAALDADNVYGYDKAYATMATHSMGSAAHIHVDSNSYGTAEFNFWGTGFDVISLTSSATGTITVLVKDASGKTVRNTVVDTYYGMEENGKVSVNEPDTIYQVPVIKIYGLDYGQYTVKITAAYNAIFDHAETKGDYELYLDAIRIYDPTGNEDATANNAYKEDGEAYPVYTELRNNIIKASNYVVTEKTDGSFSVTGSGSDGALAGGIFIDCNNGTTSIADYVSYGPNNELYLANNQAIAFNVNVPANVADIQLGIKMANGNPVTYQISAVNTAGTVVKQETVTVSSATDMYYSILEYAKAGTVTIKNVSGGILSLTNIKVTHTSAPTAASEANVLSMDAKSVGVALMTLRGTPVVIGPSASETLPTEPETSEPVEPETSEPAEPETSEPVEPETSEPVEPETSEPVEPETSEPVEPETSEPVEPETSEPVEPETSEPVEPEVEPEDPEETEVFEPAKLKVYLSGTSVKVGNPVIVTVNTSADVQSLTVNGQAVTRYVYNRWTGTKIWVVTVTAEAIGEMAVDVVAYSEAGLASEAVSKTVTVTRKSGSFFEDLIGWIFG